MIQSCGNEANEVCEVVRLRRPRRNASTRSQITLTCPATSLSLDVPSQSAWMIYGQPCVSDASFFCTSKGKFRSDWS